MASESKARRVVGDVLLVGGFFVFIGAQVVDDWGWFFGIMALGGGLIAVSLLVVPFRDQLARLGRAPVKDPSHELNVPSAGSKGRKDAI
jgi:hypothetical protein